MKLDIKKILEAAILAPSGENSQPWLFDISEPDVVEVYLRPEQNASLYGWGHRASYVAIGAAIENASIASAAMGFDAEVNLFPEGENSLRVAKIQFKASLSKAQETLAEVIPNRCTNRKPFKTSSLKEEYIQKLLEAGNSFGAECVITQNRADVTALAHIGSFNEVVMLNNPNLHDYFFSHVNWTKKDDDEKKVGFFIDTLELPPPAKLIFRFISKWKNATLLNKIIGLNKVVGKQNGAVNAKAAGIGVITGNINTPESAVNAGRALQRLWLTATQLGLSLQPLTGVLYFHMRILAGETDHFSASDVEGIEDRYKKLATIFNIEDKIPFFMFRIGRGELPTARASRFTLKEVTKVI